MLSSFLQALCAVGLCGGHDLRDQSCQEEGESLAHRDRDPPRQQHLYRRVKGDRDYKGPTAGHSTVYCRFLRVDAKPIFGGWKVKEFVE